MQMYLALGDSMSIDDYTGVKGGGAVMQFFRTLGDEWKLDDRTFDGCCMSAVPRNGHGDLITLTIGGNDLLRNAAKYLSEGLADFAEEHADLLADLRRKNPTATLIVGDVYAPAIPLGDTEARRLREANAIIQENCKRFQAQLAPINATFRSHESTYLCLGIEPALAGAREIARLFEGAFRAASSAAPRKTEKRSWT